MTLTLIALLGVVASSALALWIMQVERSRQAGELSERMEQVVGSVNSRFAKYETLLHAGRALFAGSEYVSRFEWALFTREVLSGQNLPGLLGLAWAPYVDDPVGLGLLSDQRMAEGLSSIEVRPPGERPFYCPIVYNEPIENNADSIGRDICEVAPLHDALRETREQGTALLSSPVRYQTGQGAELSGYAMLIWIEDRGSNHTGWISASIEIEDLFGETAQAPSGQILRVEDTTDAASLVYGPSDEASGRVLQRPLSVSRVFESSGRSWRLTLGEPSEISIAALMALFGGLLSTGLLVAYLLALFQTRSRAEGLAERMTERLRESEGLLASITNNIFEGIYRGNVQDGLLYANDSLARMFGYEDPEQMIEHAGPILYARTEQRDDLLELMLKDGYYRDVEVEFIRADGSKFVGVNNAVATFDEDGEMLYFDGAISDITARKEAERQVHRLAHYDILTGLPNRAMLDRRLRQAIAHAESTGQSMALLFMDLDHFKTINDSLGHSLGDELLIKVAKRLGGSLRSDDSVSRLGGDEFLILLSDVGANGAASGAARILALFSDPFDLEGHELRVTPSIGISMFPDDATEAESLIRNADAAMYAAKEKGRANYQFFTPDMNLEARERLTLESDLRQALRAGQLSLHYQPVVQLSNRKIVGAEALLRWNHPELGDISPVRFIPIAEQSGLIVEIGDWVIREACRQLAAWMRDSIDPLPIAVNVSALQFWRGGLVDQVRAALDANALDAEWLELELTESVIMRDAETASHVIKQLNGLGVGLSIDDFGTGYSSLSYLKRFSISKLKIDQSFVQDLGHDPDDAAIVSAVVSMAEDLGLTVVGEGVETEDQRRMLLARGCHLAQGFLFDRPMPAEEFRERLRGNRTAAARAAGVSGDKTHERTETRDKENRAEPDE